MNISKFVGSWEDTQVQTDKKTYCNSTLRLNVDGSYQYASADKSQNGRFKLSKLKNNSHLIGATPLKDNVYKITLTTLKDSGGTSCDGDTTDWTGKEQVLFVRPLSSIYLSFSPCEDISECLDKNQFYSRSGNVTVNDKSLPECADTWKDKYGLELSKSLGERFVYPKEAVPYQIEGTALAALFQDSMGRTISAEIIKSSGNYSLDNAIMTSIKNVDFSRGCFIAKPAIILMPFQFKIPERDG